MPFPLVVDDDRYFYGGITIKRVVYAADVVAGRHRMFAVRRVPT
jgi:hypothetical protein